MFLFSFCSFSPRKVRFQIYYFLIFPYKSYFLLFLLLDTPQIIINGDVSLTSIKIISLFF